MKREQPAPLFQVVPQGVAKCPCGASLVVKASTNGWLAQHLGDFYAAHSGHGASSASTTPEAER